MLPSAGLAAEEQQELGSTLLEVAPHQCALTPLRVHCPSPDPALGLLLSSAHPQVFEGTGWVAVPTQAVLFPTLSSCTALE